MLKEQNKMNDETESLRSCIWEEDDEILPEADIFSNRAELILKSKKQVTQDFCFEVEDSPKKVDEEKDFMAHLTEKLHTKTRKRKAKSPDKIQNVAPQKPIKVSKRKGKKNEETYEPLVEDITALLPAASRRKLSKLQTKINREQKLVDAEVDQILNACNPDADIDRSYNFDQSFETEIVLQVRYKGEITRIRVNEKEKFSSIFSKVSESLKMKASEILLCLGDRNIDINDTPSNLNLKYFDTIDCISFGPEINVEENHNTLLLRIQSNDSRKKVDIYTHKLEKFSEIIKRYASGKNVPAKDVVFEFDGDRITDEQTPEDLDIEHGSCIDVKIVGMSAKPAPPVVDLSTYEPQSTHPMLCVVDID